MWQNVNLRPTMPNQPNHCTGCGKLMPYTDAAYYCSKKCMDAVRGKFANDDYGCTCHSPGFNEGCPKHGFSKVVPLI